MVSLPVIGAALHLQRMAHIDGQRLKLPLRRTSTPVLTQDDCHTLIVMRIS